MDGNFFIRIFIFSFLMFYFPHFEVRSKRILVIKYFKWNKIEDTKTLIRNRKSKDSHYNGQKKKEKNDGHCYRYRKNMRFISTYAVNPYHLKSCELDYYPWRGVVNAISFDKVCQYFVAGRLLFPSASSRRRSMVSTNVNLRQCIYSWNTFFFVCVVDRSSVSYDGFLALKNF